MKHNKSFLTMAVVACGLAFASCSDEYMENMNTDPSKAAVLDPNAQLTTAQLQTYGDLETMETYRSYVYAFTQQLMGCWNTTNYGGRHTIDNNEMSHIWVRLYTVAVKNVTDAMVRTNDDASKVNINSILRIYRVYLMSLITDVYGDAPYKEAGYGFLDGKFTPAFDKQEDIYNDFFETLSDAASKLDPTADKVTGDVIYGGDVMKWKALANSLRLRYAMRISNVAPEKAKAEFKMALAAEGGVITSKAEDALIKYMDVSFSFGGDAYSDYRRNALSQKLFGNDPANNPSYLCSTFFNQMYNNDDPRTFRIARCYYDDKVSIAAPDNHIDITDEMLAKGIGFQPRDPGAYSWEPWPTGYDSDICKALNANDPSVKVTMDREVEPKLSSNFMKSTNPGVVITSAEVKFLEAEALLKGWDVAGASAEQLYKDGVREAMQFIVDNYKCDPIADSDIDAYLADKGAFGYTNEKKIEAINTQAWILHFTNPLECWANMRRSGYPKVKSPNDYGFGQFLTGGNDIPVRLSYPILESSYNKKNYNDALDRMGGTNDWHINMWWDKE